MAETAFCNPPPVGRMAMFRALPRFRTRSTWKTVPGTSTPTSPQASALPPVNNFTAGTVATMPNSGQSSRASPRRSASTPRTSSSPSTGFSASRHSDEWAARRGEERDFAGAHDTSNADMWIARRREERNFVGAHDTTNTDVWYLIDVPWLHEWKRFVTQGGPVPGPLRPEALIDRRTGRPKPNLQPIHDYRGVNEVVWTYWLQKYGGGPAVRRRKLDLYSTPSDDLSLPLPATTSSCSSEVFFVREANACIVPQPPDGSCLFHSLCCGLDDGSTAASLRLEISKFISDNPDLTINGTALKDWVKFDSGGGVDSYAADIAGGLWGGGIEMEVFVRIKNVIVHVYEACSLGGYRRIACFDGPKATRTVSVLYRERNSRGMEHYDALLLEKSAGQWIPRSSLELGASGGA